MDQASCTEPATADALYLLAPARGGAALRPLDPDSLADQPGCAWLPNRAPTIPFATSRWSEDDSLVASIESEQQPGGAPWYVATIVVQDALTGEERSRFVPQGPIGSELRFTPDGTFLLVQGWYATWRPDSVAWYVVDTASGGLQATLLAERGAYGHPFFGSAGSHLYRLFFRTSIEPGGRWTPESAAELGPWPLEIVVNDLAAGGGEIARLTLPSVREGTWWSERWSNDSPISTRLTPGAALSPDRRWLALAHADEPAVTIVDLAELAVVRTVVATRPARLPTLWERLGELTQLGLAARTAHAKEFDGQSRRARFMPDGRRLLVWGGETRIDNGTMSEEPVPLRLYDLEAGRLLAELSIESSMPDVLVAPDGRALYVAARPPVASPWQPSRAPPPPPYHVRRLSATTLAVLAQREVAAFPGRLYTTREPGFPSDWLLTPS
jgi:hypothetical protein